MEPTPEKRGRGRQVVPDEQRKKHRGLSCTDAEWNELLRQAKATGAKGPSEYIVKKLKLTPKG